jgi:hypothetical protein
MCSQARTQPRALGKPLLPPRNCTVAEAQPAGRMIATNAVRSKHHRASGRGGCHQTGGTPPGVSPVPTAEARSNSTRFEGVAMSERVSHRFGRLQGRHAQRQAQVDAADELAAERSARPGLRHDAAAGPELNRQERVIVTVYLVLGILIVLFLAATGVLWWLGG